MCAPERFDAVLLAVPNDSKLALLEHFLGLGKHVLVEKPLILPDRQTAVHLDRLAKQHQVVWYTSYNHRFEPLVEALHQRLSGGEIGRVYHARFLYGNGTVRHVMGSWRESGLGVLEDLGSHLLDLAGHLLGCRGAEFRAWSLEHHESRAFDHAIFASVDGRIVLEASFLSWKNSFSIEVFGEKWSIHALGLPKWGDAELVVRERVLPSGVPNERRERAHAGVDVTWERDLEWFERLAAEGGPTSMENDWWISRTLRQVAAV